MPGNGALVEPVPDADISLLDILDNVLTSGVVVHGSIVISLAGVDLVYLGLNAVLTSVETALRHLEADRRKAGKGQGSIAGGRTS